MVQGLRTNIAVRVAVLLIMAMFLIDFILVISSQRLLKLSASNNAQTILSTLKTVWTGSVGSGPERNIDTFRRYAGKLTGPSRIACMMILEDNRPEIVAGNETFPRMDSLRDAVKNAMASGLPSTRYADKTWGVFWRQERYLMLAEPMGEPGNGRVAGGIGIAVSFEGIYRQMRTVQNMILVYIAVNTVLLSIIGVYGLSQVTLKPLRRLVNRADEYSYRLRDDMAFLYEKDANEFNKLSKSLNRMLQQISEDKEKLKTTIRSLETANTDLKNAQSDIIRAEKFASIGRLTAGLAHEIGNPIGIILGYLDLLKQPDLSVEEKREFIGRAQSEINRINGIVRQLLEFSRPSDVDKVILSVHDLISDIADICKTMPLTAGMRITLDLNAETDWVRADADQLRQVFLNLVINSADAIMAGAAPYDGELCISSENENATRNRSQPETRRLKLTFSDNGTGIPDGCIENIFDPFFTTKEPGKGTGLGLSVSYSIIEDMGGTIEARSTESAGTTIMLMLPTTDCEDIRNEC